MSRTPARAFAVIAEATLPIAAVTTVLVSEIESIVHTRPDLRLRIAVHRGDIPTERVVTCVDVTIALEAATSAAVTDVLAGVRGASCAVVVTQRVYDTVVRLGRGGNNPSLFTLVNTADGTGLHVRVPGYPRLPKPPPRHDDPPRMSTGHVGKLNYFAGPVQAKRIGDNYYGHDHE